MSIYVSVIELDLGGDRKHRVIMRLIKTTVILNQNCTFEPRMYFMFKKHHIPESVH